MGGIKPLKEKNEYMVEKGQEGEKKQGVVIIESFQVQYQFEYIRKKKGHLNLTLDNKKSKFYFFAT